MSDSETLTIKAELLSDIAEVAERDRLAMKEMTDSLRSSSADMVSAIGQLGDRLDTTHKRTQQVASGSTRLKKAYDDLYESGGRLRESVTSLGESIHYRLQYPMMQLTYTLEAAAGGMVAFGLVTASSMQQGQLALANLTGSASLAGQAIVQLRSLQGAVGLSQLEGGYSALFQAGMTPGQTMSAVTGLSGLAAVSGNPNQAFPAMAQAVAAMRSTGLLTTSDVQAFSGSNVDIWGMLAKETGQTPDELRLRFLRAGTPMAVPGTFMSDLMSSPGATGGTAAYNRTWAGQLEETKKAAGDLLAVIETPLGNALSRAGSKLDAWAQGTERRFKQLGGSLGQEWSSGNMGGLSHTLASVVGDPRLAGDIDVVVTSLHGLVNITEHSLIPMGKDVMAVATPALKGLADVLDFMGQHRTETDALIGTLGGLVVLARVARWTENATNAIKAFSLIMKDQGVLSALAAWSRGLGNLASSQEAVAVSAEAETGSEAAAGAGGLGLGGIGGLGKLGVLGGAAGAAYLGYQGMTSKKLTLGSGFETVAGDAAAGAMFGSVIPGVGTGAGALAGGALGLGDVLGRAIFGGSTHHTTIRNAYITVPGAGNPQKVANAIPKALNAQIVAQQQMAARRGSTS